MMLKNLTYTLAAAGMILGTTAQAAASVPARGSASVEHAEGLSGDTGLIPVAVAILAILAIIIFDNDDDPVSP